MIGPATPYARRTVLLAAAAALATLAAASQASAAVSVTSPAEGATVSGVIPVKVAMESTDRIRTTRIVAGRRAFIRTTDFQAAAGVSVLVDTSALGTGRRTISVVVTDRFGKSQVLRRNVVVAAASANARANAAAGFRFSVPKGISAGSSAVIGFSGGRANRADRVAVRLDGRLISNSLVRRGSFARVASHVSGSRLTRGRHVLSALVRTNGVTTRHRRVFVIARGATPPPSGVGGPLPGTPAFNGDFETGDFSQWRNAKGFADGVIQAQAPDRVRIVRSPVAQGAFAARFEVRPGDEAAKGNRAEVLHGTNEHEGDERWYEWHTNFDPSYPRNSNWQIFTQWHAAQGRTQPMVRFNANGDSISFSTVESSAPGRSGAERVLWRAPMNRGTWHTFRLHAKWSSSRSSGFVELYYNGKLVVPRTPSATMIPGIDRNYVKQGLYRSRKNSGTSVLYHDGFRMSIVK